MMFSRYLVAAPGQGTTSHPETTSQAGGREKKKSRSWTRFLLCGEESFSITDIPRALTAESVSCLLCSIFPAHIPATRIAVFLSPPFSILPCTGRSASLGHSSYPFCLPSKVSRGIHTHRDRDPLHVVPFTWIPTTQPSFTWLPILPTALRSLVISSPRSTRRRRRTTLPPDTTSGQLADLRAPQASLRTALMASAITNPDPRAVSEDPGSLSAGSKARFTKYAARDDESGEQYLGPDQFIDAIAPIDEDYVRFPGWSLRERRPTVILRADISGPIPDTSFL